MNREILRTFQTGSDKLNELRTKLTEKKVEFEEINKDLIENIRNEIENLDLIKSNIKEHAIEDYEKTGDKKLLGGIGIRVGTLLEYEIEKALAWAKEHSLCLTLDKREFEKIAKTQDIEFVKKGEKITVTFPKKIEIEQ